MTSSQLNMITDESRVLFRLFGLRKSFKKVWCTQSLIYYAEQLTLNRELPKAYQDIEDDPHQMGGNFIVEIDSSNDKPTFKVIYIYKSESPPDRPSAQKLLEFLKQNI